MRAFLQCIKEAWVASRPTNTFFYNTLLFEDQTDKFRDLAASIIEDEDLKTDLEDILLKTPSEADARDANELHDARQRFVSDGRIQ